MVEQESSASCEEGLMIQAYFNLAEYSFTAGDTRRAISFAKKSLRPADTSAALRRKNMVLYNLLGNAYTILGNGVEAIDNYRKAKRLAKEMNNGEAYTSIVVNESSVLTSMGDYEVALETLIAAEQEFEASGNNSARAIVLNNLGELYREGFGQGKKSIGFYRKAMRLNLAAKDKLNLSKNLQNLALAFKEVGQADSARFYLARCEALLKEAGTLSSLVKCYYNMAQMSLEQEEWSTARTYFEQSLELSEEIDFELGLFYGNMGLAELTVKQERYSEANTYLEKARVNKPTTYELNLEQSYFLTRYNYLMAVGKLKEALQLSEEFYSTRDSIQALRNEETILELRAGYESDITQEEHARLTAEKDRAEASIQNEKEQKRLYLALSLLSGIVLILVVYFFFQKQRSYIQQRDLSRQLKEKNKQLLLAEKRLKAESDMKTKILSVMGHDLRAPFASIAGLLTIVNEDMLSLEEAKEVTGKLSIEVEHTLTSLSNILAWSRLQLNDTGIWKTRFNVHVLFAGIQEMILPAANAKQIKLEISCARDAEMYADNNQIRSILNNLLNNALKFTNNGGKVCMEHSENETEHILRVSDTGTGMSKEALYAINNKISHTSAGTLGEKGTGIGISLVHDFTQLHGGTLNFYVNEPQGTLVEVRIPKENEEVD